VVAAVESHGGARPWHRQWRRVVRDWRLHRQHREQLEQMILEDIADGAHFLIEAATPADPEVLRHRDLHVVDVVSVPEGLQECVGEPEVQQILDGLFPEEMIDAIDRGLGEDRMQRLVERFAEARSRPNGFSTTRRAWPAHPACASPVATGQKRLGGIAR
jgi:hypothetical protein